MRRLVLKHFFFAGAIALLACPLFGGTILAGFEDWTGLDYDYNDVVFSLSGNGLALHSSAEWFTEPSLGTSASPFWNRSSMDGPNYNVGYCIYGGGSCDVGVGFDPSAKYLAANQTSTGSANDVTFSGSGAIELTIHAQTTDAYDRFGWYALSDPTSVHWLNLAGHGGTYDFSPGTSFGLVGQSQGQEPHTGYTYYSQTMFGSQDDVSHFAFFSSDVPAAVPEPGATELLVLGSLAIFGGLQLRRRTHS